MNYPSSTASAAKYNPTDWIPLYEAAGVTRVTEDFNPPHLP